MSAPGLRARMKAMTRDAIVDAADRLFLERGYANVSLDDVAGAAGVSLRTLYRYFETDTKESIALAREHDMVELFEQGLAAREGDVVSFWRAFVARGGDELTTRGEDWLRRHIELIHANPALEARNRLVNARLERLLAAGLAEETGDDGIGPSLFAAALIAGNTAVIERCIRSGDPIEPATMREAIDYLVEVFTPKLRRTTRR